MLWGTYQCNSGFGVYASAVKVVRIFEQRSDDLRAGFRRLVACLCGLIESEFTHILGTFPLVDPGVRAAALEAFRARAQARLRPYTPPN
jgi:hypothetical protein